jgi:hypothetical protein
MLTVRLLWTRFRTRELLWGVIWGSVAAVVFDLARNGASTLWAVLSVTFLLKNPSTRAPVAFAMIAGLGLILPRFFRRSVCLFRSWRVGLIRGTTLGWGIATFLY